MTLEPSRPANGAPWLRLGVVAVLLLLDLWSKSAVFAWLQDGAELARCPCGLASHNRWHLLGESVGWFTFMEATNSGAAFGLGASWPAVLVGGRVVAVIVLLVLLLRTPPGKKILTTAFVLILAGALGNLYDNIGRANWSGWWNDDAEFSFGAVRDFIDVYFSRWSWHFPTFNVADSCISVGAVLLLASGLFGHGEDSEAPGTPPPDDDSKPPPDRS